MAADDERRPVFRRPGEPDIRAGRAGAESGQVHGRSAFLRGVSVREKRQGGIVIAVDVLQPRLAKAGANRGVGGSDVKIVDVDLTALVPAFTNPIHGSQYHPP
jgi:hypothetical protein